MNDEENNKLNFEDPYFGKEIILDDEVVFQGEPDKDLIEYENLLKTIYSGDQVKKAIKYLQKNDEKND